MNMSTTKVRVPTQTSEKMIEGNATDLVISFRNCRNGFLGIAIFSCIINVLMLSGPLFMLQVYDRVLTSKSIETLFVLIALVFVLYVFLALFEFIRTRVSHRIGDDIHRYLAERLFGIWINHAAFLRKGIVVNPLRDAQTLKSFASGSLIMAVFDLPWVPAYLALIFLLHWSLGLVACAGMLVSIGLALLNDRATSKNLENANRTALQAATIAQEANRNAEVLMAMGMQKGLFSRWSKAEGKSQELHRTAADRGSIFSVSTKSIRLFVQSAMLAVGALLAIEQIITPGVMIASSIIMGRALAPIDQLISGWKNLVSTAQAFKRLRALFSSTEPDAERTELPEPKGVVEVNDVRLANSQKPSGWILDGLQLTAHGGQAIGVIGPSASGKSSLARLLTGIWLPDAGEIRMDGATFNQWGSDALGKWIGYLPQEVELFSGSVKENISRFSSEADDEAVILAAHQADAHAMILELPNGYDTQIGENGTLISGGQKQRIGLARAFFGTPCLIVLDEPNSNLDHEGEQALQHAIKMAKEKGQIVFVMAHRPSAIAEVDFLLMLRNGRQVAFGPKEEVLKSVLENNRKVPNV